MNVSSFSLSLTTAKSLYYRKENVYSKMYSFFIFLIRAHFIVPECACLRIRLMRAWLFTFRNKVAAHTGNRSNNNFFFVFFSPFFFLLSVHSIYLAFYCRLKLCLTYSYIPWNATKFSDRVWFFHFYFLLEPIKTTCIEIKRLILTEWLIFKLFKWYRHPGQHFTH